MFCWSYSVIKQYIVTFSKFMNKNELILNHLLILSIHVFLLYTGVLDKPGSEFTGIFGLRCDQVPEDPAGSETSQSSVQI